MTSRIEYFVGQELPDLELELTEPDGTVIDLSAGYTFAVKIGIPGDTATVSKSTGFTSSSDSPNLVVAWSTTELSALTAGVSYTLQVNVTRTADSKDRIFQVPFMMFRSVL